MDLSQHLLNAVRYNEPVDSLLHALANYNRDQLASELDNETKRKVFWINIYNANIQIALKKDTVQYEDYMSFFNKESITIAGEFLSPNDIEHGIIRGGQWLYGLGYMSSWFRSDFKKQFALDTLDPRIHFALNCGARSCPPILFYTEGGLDEELELATKNFLYQSIKVEDKDVIVSKIFSWYRGDFQGKKGILSFIQSYGYLEESLDDYAVKFDDYNWKLQLDMYANQ